MLFPILSLYLLGFIVLLLSDIIGLGISRFRNVSVFIGVLLGYLTIITTYAFVKTSGNTVAIVLLLWLIGFVFFIHKCKNKPLLTRKEYGQRVLVISVLWSAIFILKSSFFWNSEYNCPNLLFIDNNFYIKVAEGFNWSGHENALGLKNMLFPFLDFAQPYRSNDFWLMSFGLDLTPFDSIYIWELFYSTIILFLCSLSMFVLLKTKFNRIASFFLAILLLFAFSGSWYLYLFNLIYPGHSGGFDPVGIIAYTKLAILFSILFHFFYNYEKGMKIKAIYLLLLMPILVQSAISIFLIVLLLFLAICYQEIVINKNSYKEYIQFLILYSIIGIAFMLFYLINQQHVVMHLGQSNLSISNFNSILEVGIHFVKKAGLLLISYYWLSCLIVMVLLYTTKNLKKSYRKEIVFLLAVFYFSAILVYAWFNKVGDAYQFATNVFGPFVLSLILYLFIQTPIQTPIGKLKIGILVLISLIGMKEVVGGNNFFHSTLRINSYSKTFIHQVQNALPQLNYPFGLIFYGEAIENNYKEDYPQFESAFLKLFGRNYDVFNIEADSLRKNLDDESFQKKNFFMDKNAFNVWRKNFNKTAKISKQLTRKDFYEAYPFSFCISKIKKDRLPLFIKEDIVGTIQDANSKIYFYTLKRNKLNSLINSPQLPLDVRDQ